MVFSPCGGGRRFDAVLSLCGIKGMDARAHIVWLPQSIGFILYGLFHFFAVWRWEKLYRAEFQKRVDAGGSVWKNMDLSKGKDK